MSSAGAPERAMGAFGNTMTREAEEVGNIIGQHQAKLRQQDLENKKMIIGSAYDDEERAFEEEEKQRKGEESYQNIDRAGKFREQSIKKFTKDVKDPELKLKIEGHIRSRSNSLMDKLAAHQANERKYVTKQAIESVLASVLKDAYAGEDLQKSVDKFREAVKAQHDTEQRGTEESVAFMVNGEAAVAEAHLDGIINRSPEAGIAAIKSGQYNKYLPQKKIEEYDKKAKDLSTALQKDSEHRQKEVELAEQKKLKAEREAIGNEFFSKAVKGELFLEDILKSKLEPTGENSKAYWRGQIDKAVKDDYKTDKATDASLFTRIVQDPESVPESEILDAMNARKLTRASADSLLTERRQRLNPQKDPVRAAAESAVVENFKRDRKAGIFGKDQSGDIEYAKQIDAFKRWSNAHPNDDPSEYYEKVMEPKKLSAVKEILDWVPFVNPERVNPKKARESMQKSGEIPQRRATDKKQSGKPAATFDEANMKSQEQWIAKHETDITKKLKGKPAGTYRFPGNNIPIKWDGNGGFTISIQGKR